MGISKEGRKNLFLAFGFLIMGVGLLASVVSIVLADTIEIVGMGGLLTFATMIIGGMIINFALNERMFSSIESMKKAKEENNDKPADPMGSSVIRRAMAVSIFLMFCGLIIISETLSDKGGFIVYISKHFWIVFLTVIGFYFGTRGLESAAEIFATKLSKISVPADDSSVTQDESENQSTDND